MLKRLAKKVYKVAQTFTIRPAKKFKQWVFSFKIKF